ncbi:MAG: HAD hydrolase-like protein, partial [archaeon]
KHSPRLAIMVGDSPSDILASRALGIPSIGVATGGYNLKKLRDMGATRSVSLMLQLARIKKGTSKNANKAPGQRRRWK